MAVDVQTEIDIARPPAEVAAYACEPANAPSWYQNIRSVEWPDGQPAELDLGTRIAFVAHFLGRRLAYTYEIVHFEPGRSMVMRTAEGPFPMETSYGFDHDGKGGTTMTLRNRGEPAGFGRLAGPLLAAAMRRANAKDLEALKRLLEARG